MKMKFDYVGEVTKPDRNGCKQLTGGSALQANIYG